AEGEPGRVITGGVGPIPGETVYAKMRHLAEEGDGLRKLMLREPRGYPGLCCNLLVPPTHLDADMGFIIMEQMEYAPMSGSNTICVTTVLLETGILPMIEPVTELVLESPAGLVKVTADCANGKVTRVTFENVPSFAIHLNVPVEVPTLGTIKVDVAWGGMMYVLFEGWQVGLNLTPDEGADCVRYGEMVKAATREQYPTAHPETPELTGPTIAMITGNPVSPHAHGRNTVVISTGTFDWGDQSTWTGALDRSACGTGTSARMAVLNAKGALGMNRDFVHESILGTTFVGRLIGKTKVGPYDAVIPTISGQAWITGIAQYVVDPTDPFPEGFRVADIWGGIDD
ncbi:MAG: proline racemase family protein, partial [Chloroflexota bacterium]|nr:proline racemase family protein [Chloroflexota bacterium]